MNAITRILAVLLALNASAGTPSKHATARATREIVNQVTQASGGLAAAQAIRALEYRLRIREPTYQANAVYLVDRRGRMRIDVSKDGKRVYTECLDGKQAWQMAADGIVKPESADGAAALFRGTQSPGQIFALAELPAHGHRIAFVGRQKIDGVDYQVLRLIMSNGFESYRYIDPHTHRIMRSRDSSALHPDVDPSRHPSETTWSDYRRVDGVWRPFKSVHMDLRSHQILQTVEVKSIRTLPKLPDALLATGSVRFPATP